jgi:two-component system, chemotaxis family, protein-glutamate methylesterase/glutaminase
LPGKHLADRACQRQYAGARAEQKHLYPGYSTREYVMSTRKMIAVGGSLGGIDAAKQLFAALPKDFPAAVFTTIHVGASGLNAIAEVLGSGSTIPVKTAVDGESVQVGQIYVAPADHHLLVLQNVVRLGRGPRENMARPAIDPMLRSVGISCGGSAIGVVLSGQLNDGAAGLADLKRCGGLAVVQNPSDAEAGDMPLAALNAVDVDYRAPAADLGALLMRLVEESAGPPIAPPAEIRLEVDIALGRPVGTEATATIATPVPLTCPQCSGVLSEIKRGPPLRFRCQVGHAFTAEALEAERESTIDEAIRVSLRIIEERAVLMEKMAQDARRSGRTGVVPDYERRGHEYRAHADTLRRALLSCGSC